MNRLVVSCLLGLSLGCTRHPKHEEQRRPNEARQLLPPRPSAQPKVSSVEPIVLAQMPVSAYATSLALDDEAAYLMTPNAAYRLVAGQPAHGIELELGIGPVMTRDAFIYWHAGSIWRTPKAGGPTGIIAKLPHQPQYFVSSGDNPVWVDKADDGVYTIQTLDGRNARVLVKSEGELSALNPIGDAVFFVNKAPDSSWRIGKVSIAGSEPTYAAPKSGPTPSTFTGTDHLVYWDLKTSEIRMLPLDLGREQTWLKNLVCSPIYEARNVYCGCVEGLFEVAAHDHAPRVLSHGRRETITFVRANSKQIVWTVDRGPNQLAVNMLPTSEAAHP
jgi:hypothetical protein